MGVREKTVIFLILNLKWMSEKTLSNWLFIKGKKDKKKGEEFKKLIVVTPQLMGVLSDFYLLICIFYSLYTLIF